MFPLLANKERAAINPPLQLVPSRALEVQTLTSEHTAEVQAFLAQHPLHTVVMASFIRDNGIVSPLNRGTFYACRNADGQLEGVALIGHATLIEARTDEALAAFTRLAKQCPNASLIMGEREKISDFWGLYAGEGESPRLACRELLFELRSPVEVREAVEGLRQATLDDLELIMPAHAQMAFEESGINPMEADPEGFRRRCARRIEMGRVWVWVVDGRLIFKADIIAETPQVVYLEGIYVDPQERGKHFGLRCMSQLGRSLLGRVGSVSVLVNEQNQRACGFYRKAGYKLCGYYDTIYLHRKMEN